ncbi:MAG: hypothetical protein FJX46_02260 [Alphaproteobacteria bacterium]|nr:hypothetical protein [Alphaproteobacteria bacterium]
MSQSVPNYAISFRESGGGFVFAIEALGVISKGTTVEEAYANLKQKRDSLVQEFRDLDSIDLLPAPRTTEKTTLSDQPSGLKATALRSLVAAAVIGAVLAIGLGGLVAIARMTFENPFSGIMRPSQYAVWMDTIGDGLKRITPERKQQMIEGIRLLATEIKPYAAELRPLLQELSVCGTGGGTN